MKAANNSSIFWDEFWVRQQHYVNPAYVLAEKMLPKIDKASLVDVGCGCGCGMGVFYANRPEWSFIGVDFSEVAIRTAMLVQSPGTFYVGDANMWLPQRVDVVTMVHLVENLDKPLDVIKRFLQRCSEMIIVSPYKSSPSVMNNYTHLVKMDESSFDMLEPMEIGVTEGNVIYRLKGGCTGGR